MGERDGLQLEQMDSRHTAVDEFPAPPPELPFGGKGGGSSCVFQVASKLPGSCTPRVLEPMPTLSVSLIACAVLHAFLNVLWKGSCYLVVFLGFPWS